MLYFIILLKSSGVSADFAKVSSLLERTLSSICNQTCRDFRVLVLCHEEPEGVTNRPEVEYVSVPFTPPPPSVLGLPHEERLFAMRSDKGRKLLRGLEIARNEDSDYVMFVDADDLVSRRIAELCRDVGHPNGWLINKGYRMDEAHPWIAYRRKRFNYECGSSYILRTAKALFPAKVDYSLDVSDAYIRRYEAHTYIAKNMAKEGVPLGVCPFYGAVYYFNDQAIFSKECRRPDSILRVVFRALIKGRLVTDSFRAEFGIQPHSPSEKTPSSTQLETC